MKEIFNKNKKITTTVKHPYTPGLASNDKYNHDDYLTAKIQAVVAGILFGLIFIIAVILILIYK